MVDLIKGNKREIPAGMPPAQWFDLVRTYERMVGALQLSYYDSVFEHLTPVELTRLKAKIVVWRAMTGAWPDDLSVWWEVRQARNAGLIPMPTEVVLGYVENDILHCGNCGARWSDRPERCSLCGRLIEITG